MHPRPALKEMKHAYIGRTVTVTADCVTVSNEEHAIARVISDIERGVYTL